MDTFQIRRGSTAARLNYTPADGEPVYDLEQKLIYIGDGTTPGGIPTGSNSPSIAGAGEATAILNGHPSNAAPEAFSAVLAGRQATTLWPGATALGLGKETVNALPAPVVQAVSALLYDDSKSQLGGTIYLSTQPVDHPGNAMELPPHSALLFTLTGMIHRVSDAGIRQSSGSAYFSRRGLVVRGADDYTLIGSLTPLGTDEGMAENSYSVGIELDAMSGFFKGLYFKLLAATTWDPYTACTAQLDGILHIYPDRT